MKIKNKKGFTIIEVILALAVFAIIIGIFYIYNKITIEHKTKVLYQQILTIDDAVNSIYATNRAYTGLTNSLIVNSNYIKDSLLHDYKANNDGFTSSFGGIITVFQDTVGVPGSSSMTTYSISVYGVPVKACIQLASSLFNYYDAINLNYGMAANGKELSTIDSKAIKSAYTNVKKMQDIIDDCQDQNNSLLMIFTRR